MIKENHKKIKKDILIFKDKNYYKILEIKYKKLQL